MISSFSRLLTIHPQPGNYIGVVFVLCPSAKYVYR
jgi:hypothetical protein